LLSKVLTAECSICPRTGTPSAATAAFLPAIATIGAMTGIFETATPNQPHALPSASSAWLCHWSPDVTEDIATD
jgi:hypothetical protein